MRRAETVDEGTAVDPADLVTLAELCAEGFGWDGAYVATPRDAIDSLAKRLDGEVVLDDIGRRCVTRSTARGLFTERDEAERRRCEVEQRRQAEAVEQAARNRPWAGVSAASVPDGVSAATVMLAAAKDAGPRRQSVLDHALANEGQVEFHPVAQEPR
jgi:hypothetical protein